MIRKALEAAGIKYEYTNGRFADFHSLRHTYASNLARGGVHPRVTMKLMLHKKLELTFGIYTSAPSVR
jgi:site-specific recombinase XerD